MKEFSFYIPAENYTYSFSLPSEMMGGGVFVDPSGLRHPDFSVNRQTANNLGFSALGNALMGMQAWQEYEEFKRDLESFVNKIIETHREISHESLDYAMLAVCKEHIKRCGRLLYNDLLGYADLATCVDKAIYQGTTNSYHDFYKHSVYLVLNSYPTKVLFQNAFGGFYSWADVPSE